MQTTPRSLRRTWPRIALMLCLAAFSLIGQAASDSDFAAPLWHSDGKGTAQARTLLQIMSGAEHFGLRVEDYSAPALHARLEALEQQSSATEWQQLDAAITQAVQKFVRHVHYGRIDPRAAGFNLQAARNDLDIEATVRALATSDDIEQRIAALAPPFQHYRLLIQALARYRALAQQSELTTLPAFEGKSVKPQQPYAGAAALARLLHAEGDLADAQAQAEEVTQATTLTPALSEALKQFQKRHGLQQDGALGARTFRALTTPFTQRVQQIELTLERWRWMPPLTAPPIIVNIPQFKLFAFSSLHDKESELLQMDVIVGKAVRDTRTPVFTADMKYLVFRPYWDVPRSIAVKEILPKLASNPQYLAQHHYELVRGQSDQSPVVEATPENLAAIGSGQVRLRQRPGKDNPLGNVKFMLPNNHSVYLHGTPDEHLFDSAQRTFSHGCIRLSNPQALAEFILKRNSKGNWSSESIGAAMQGDENQRVYLDKPIPVLILYGTAMAAESGTVYFFDDVYGYDKKLGALLERA